jgi:hypothetical protein
MDTSAPDVRNRAPEERRAEISGAFAQVLSLQTAIRVARASVGLRRPTTLQIWKPQRHALFVVILLTLRRQVLAKGLQKRIGNRYQTVDEMATDLYGCLVRGSHSSLCRE